MLCSPRLAGRTNRVSRNLINDHTQLSNIVSSSYMGNMIYLYIMFAQGEPIKFSLPGLTSDFWVC